MAPNLFTRSRRRGTNFVTLLAVGLQIGVLLAVEPEDAVLCGPPAPDHLIPLHVTEPAEGVARLTWFDDGSYRFDIVRGSLSVLSATQGDYALATRRCLADDLLGELDDPDLPDPGDGFWYLLRADYWYGCGWAAASYVNPEGYWVTGVDIAIRNSGRDCTCNLSCQNP